MNVLDSPKLKTVCIILDFYYDSVPSIDYDHMI